MSDESILTSKAAADRLGKTSRTIARWVAAGKLKPTLQIDGSRGAFLFTIEEVDRVLAEEAENDQAESA